MASIHWAGQRERFFSSFNCWMNEATKKALVRREILEVWSKDKHYMRLSKKGREIFEAYNLIIAKEKNL